MDSRKVLDKYFNEYQHFYNCLMYLCIWNECNEFAPGNTSAVCLLFATAGALLSKSFNGTDPVSGSL